MNKSKKTFLSVLYCALLPCLMWSQNIAPVLSASGNQPYCPNSQINIVTDFDIVDPDDTESDAIYIQISEGYVSGEDTLILLGSHPNITATWSTLEGKLVLEPATSNPVTYVDYIAAVKDIVFESTSSTPTNKSFSITIGDANYLPKTDHYYEYVPSLGITWSAAKADAASRTYFGLQGYLATLTMAEESQLAGKQAAGAGWIGGSDEETEGEWKWVTGPEAGTIFWYGTGNGYSPNYAFWNNNEPNQAGDEDYAHITAAGVGIPGSWNDLSNTGAVSGSYQPKGYIVEYGGMPGDPVLNISASTSIYTPYIEETKSDAICDGGMVSLEATASFGGAVQWYDAPTGGTLLHSDTVYDVTISTTTTYYVTTVIGSCEPASRVAVTATVTPTPTIDSVTHNFKCGSDDEMLYATASAGIVKWYDAPTGGNLLNTGTSYAISGVNTTTTYYVEAEHNNCISRTRTPVTLEVYDMPEFLVTTSPVVLCVGDVEVLATSNAQGSYTYEWRDGSGQLVSDVPYAEINAGGLYTVTATSSQGCSTTKEVMVEASDVATISDADITVVENSANNSILIDTTNLGIGIYEFALDDDGGPYQDEAYFNYLRAGTHRVYVRDKNGCGITSIEVFILGFPKFFTPNNDGKNDYWQIIGLGNNYTDASNIKLFDRYGKFIKQISAKTGTWDGIFNGAVLPSSDYWFLAELVSVTGTIKTYRGHFSLVR